MGRDKLKRNLIFKPVCREFVSKRGCNESEIELLHEEIEAIYLSDTLELYQEEAAKKMGISRPTFTRILKNARKKVATMLISGASLRIIDEKEDFRVLLASKSKNSIKVANPNAPYLHIFHISQHKLIEYEVVDNPVYIQKKRPGQILPLFVAQKHINFFITSEIGEGLKNAFLSKGVFSFVRKRVSIKDIIYLLESQEP